MLFVPDQQEGEQNWAWGAGTEHKKDEAEEESWEERQANREAATEKAEASGESRACSWECCCPGVAWQKRQANREAAVNSRCVLGLDGMAHRSALGQHSCPQSTDSS